MTLRQHDILTLVLNDLRPVELLCSAPLAFSKYQKVHNCQKYIFSRKNVVRYSPYNIQFQYSSNNSLKCNGKASPTIDFLSMGFGIANLPKTILLEL